MQVIERYEDVDLEQWQQLSRGQWFQSPQAYQFMLNIPQVLKPFLIAIENNGQLCALVQGFIPVEPMTYFKKRAIIHGGTLLTTTDTTRILLQQLQKRLKDVIYIEQRNYNDYSSYREVFQQEGFKYQPHYDFHIDVSSYEQMWQRMSVGRRRDIVRAQQEGQRIITTPSLEQVRDFYGLLKHLYEHKIHKPLFGWDFFEALFHCEQAHILLVEKQGTIIGGTVCVGEQPVLYEWYVVGEAYSTFAGIKYACDNGYQWYDMMGAGVPGRPYGVRDFKARFGGEQKEYGRFIKVNKSIRYNIGKIGLWCMQRI